MEIKLPAYVTLTNKSNEVVKFAPYKENFNTALGVGESLVLVAETAGQVFYYLKQANKALEVTQSESKTEATYDVCATATQPATVTITNKRAEGVMNFVPYRENFQFEVKPNETYTFAATTAGQVIYYMNQDVEGVLDVTVGGKEVKRK